MTLVDPTAPAPTSRPVTAAPAPHPAASLERALAALEWEAGDSSRIALAAGETSRPVRSTAGFVYLSSGAATLLTAGGEPRSLVAGDLVFFAHPGEHRIRAEADTVALDAGFEPRMRGGAALALLPDVIEARGFSAREPAMVALIESMGCTGRSRPGDAIVCSRIATTVVTVALRQWFELGCAPDAWVSRVDDPHIARALDRIHADLDRAWTVEELARIAMMSRSAFAARFREAVGHSPASYVASVRVDSGMQLLRTGELTVAQVATRLGYESEDGFSRAFRRHTGETPSLWRAAQLGAAMASVAIRPA